MEGNNGRLASGDRMRSLVLRRYLSTLDICQILLDQKTWVFFQSSKNPYVFWTFPPGGGGLSGGRRVPERAPKGIAFSRKRRRPVIWRYPGRLWLYRDIIPVRGGGTGSAAGP